MPVSIYGAGKLAELAVADDMWLALLTAYPSSTDTGSDLSEPTAGDYARVLIEGANWSTASAGSCSYDATISLSPANNWGLVVAYALCTQQTAGDVVFYEYFSPAMSITSGSSVVMPMGLLTVEVT